MNNNIYEIEKILDDEIRLITELEQKISRKRELLIKGEIDSLAENDEKIVCCENNLKNLMERRVEYSKRFGYNQPNLTEIINKTMLVDEKLAHRLLTRKLKLNNTVEKIKKTNTTNEELIKHGLNLVQSSIRIIAKIINPDTGAYNNYGKVPTRQNNVSSIIREA